MKFLGFGNGSDGDYTVSTSVTDAPIDSSCSGTSGTTSLTATNASFTAGQFILIHQTRGTGAGSYEINKIDSYSTGTITTVHELAYTYTDSGASQAQVLVLKQYGNVTISGTLTAKAWDGDKGGILAFMASGKTTISGTVTANAKGFRDGGSRDLGTGQPASYATVGENYTGNQPSDQTTQVGGGGGAGLYPDDVNSGGGGGAYGTDGSRPPYSKISGWAYGGTAYGVADLSEIYFGGAGGGYSYSGNTPAGGGRSGGIVMIFTNKITVSGSITCNGGSVSGAETCGGGGAGGSILIKSKTSTVGTNLITSTGGTSTSVGSPGNPGGAGGVGRIRIESCSISGTTNPAASTQQGGQSYCSSLTFIQ